MIVDMYDNYRIMDDPFFENIQSNDNVFKNNVD